MANAQGSKLSQAKRNARKENLTPAIVSKDETTSAFYFVEPNAKTLVTSAIAAYVTSAIAAKIGDIGSATVKEYVDSKLPSE